MKFILTAFSLLFLSANTQAYFLDFLNDSALSHFTEEEWNEFRIFMNEHIESTPDGQIFQWRSSTSGASIKAKPKISYEMAGIPCRRVSLKVEEPDKERPPEAYLMEVCKKENKWSVTTTPASDFSEEDRQLMVDAARQALNHESYGEPYAWSNAETGHYGSVVATHPTRRNNNNDSCRRLAISLASKNGLTSSGSYTLCQADGRWKLVPNESWQ